MSTTINAATIKLLKASGVSQNAIDALLAEASKTRFSFEGQTISGRQVTFSSGSVGYKAVGRVEIDGKQYHLMANIVEVGSKDRAANNSARAASKLKLPKSRSRK